MHGFVLGVAMVVSSTGVSPAPEAPRATILAPAFTFDAADTMPPPSRSTTVLQTSKPRDSLKNGLVTSTAFGSGEGHGRAPGDAWRF